MLGWNKGVNIYNFYTCGKTRRVANAVFYGDTDVYFDNQQLQAQYCKLDGRPLPTAGLLMQRELN